MRHRGIILGPQMTKSYTNLENLMPTSALITLKCNYQNVVGTSWSLLHLEDLLLKEHQKLGINVATFMKNWP